MYQELARRLGVCVCVSMLFFVKCPYEGLVTVKVWFWCLRLDFGIFHSLGFCDFFYTLFFHREYVRQTLVATSSSLPVHPLKFQRKDVPKLPGWMKFVVDQDKEKQE